MDDIDFDKEIVSVREQDYLWCFGYKTPIEKSEKASEYLITNTGKPLDFDELHKEFGLRIDKGGMIFPYDTLNWHTYLQLRSKGYEYKLFCADDPYGYLISWKRYILVDKKDKIVYTTELEKTKRAFNHESHYYCEARYNSNFEFVAEEAEDYPLYDKGLYHYIPMILNIMKGSLHRQKEDIADKPSTEILTQEIDWVLKEIDGVLGQITICKSDLLYKVSKDVGQSVVQTLKEFKEGEDTYPYPLKDLYPEFRKIEDDLQKVKEELYYTEFQLYKKVKELLPKYMTKKLEKEFGENSYIQKFLKQVEEGLNKNIDPQESIKKLKEELRGCIETE